MFKDYSLRLIAPSGFCQNQAAANRGITRLKKLGIKVEAEEIISRRYQRFAGTDEQRLDELNQLATLEHLPDIIMAVRGGYGISRLLPKIDYPGIAQQLRRHSVILCGHSDFTALQLALLKAANLTTFSGPMLAGNFGAETLSTFTADHFWGLLGSQQYQIVWQDHLPLEGQWQGQLWGGNLAMLTSLVGTPWMPTIENGILVIEDINEHPFRIERMLLQLYYAGILSRQRAIVMGSFTAAQINDYDAGYDLAQVWQRVRDLTGVPVISQLAYGHEADTVTLPLGAEATLTACGNQRQLALSGYPTLAKR